MKTQKQHFVPKFYLKNFSINNKKYVHCFDKKNGNIFCRNIRNIALEKNFYGDIDIKEGEANIAFNKIFKDESLGILSENERKSISDFAALMMIRTKQSRIDLSKGLTGSMHKIGKHLISNDDISKYEFKVTSNGHLEFIKKSTNEFSKRIMKLKWLLVINNTNLPFWTSDHPLTRENKLKQKPGFSNLGLACRGIQVHLPISSKFTISFIDPNEFSILPENFDLFDEEGVRYDNFLQVYNSQRYIYSDVNDFLLAKQILYVHPELKDGSGISLKVC